MATSLLWFARTPTTQGHFWQAVVEKRYRKEIVEFYVTLWFSFSSIDRYSQSVVAKATSIFSRFVVKWLLKHKAGFQWGSGRHVIDIYRFAQKTSFMLVVIFLNNKRLPVGNYTIALAPFVTIYYHNRPLFFLLSFLSSCCHFFFWFALTAELDTDIDTDCLCLLTHKVN